MGTEHLFKLASISRPPSMPPPSAPQPSWHCALCHVGTPQAAWSHRCTRSCVPRLSLWPATAASQHVPPASPTTRIAQGHRQGSLSLPSAHAASPRTGIETFPVHLLSKGVWPPE